jgi:hypothetical protein
MNELLENEVFLDEVGYSDHALEGCTSSQTILLCFLATMAALPLHTILLYHGPETTWSHDHGVKHLKVTIKINPSSFKLFFSGIL